MPFVATQKYLPDWSLEIFMKFNLLLLEISVFLASALYHVIFGRGFAAVTAHCKMRLLPSMTVWLRG